MHTTSKAPRGIVIRGEHVLTLRLLTDKQLGELIRMFAADASDDPVQESHSKLVQACYETMLPSVRHAQDSYSKRTESARENGKLGGRPPKQRPAQPETQLKTQPKTQPKPNRNPTGNPTETQKTSICICSSRCIEEEGSISLSPNPSLSAEDMPGTDAPGEREISQQADDPMPRWSEPPIPDDEDIPLPEECPEHTALDDYPFARGQQEQSAPHPQPDPKPAPRKPKIDLREQDWETWYAAYPKHVGKAQARKTWQAAVKSGELPDLDSLLAALRWQKSLEQWQEQQYIPNPGTYLARQQWADEPPKEKPKVYGRMSTPIENRKDDTKYFYNSDGTVDIARTFGWGVPSGGAHA